MHLRKQYFLQHFFFNFLDDPVYRPIKRCFDKLHWGRRSNLFAFFLCIRFSFFFTRTKFDFTVLKSVVSYFYMIYVLEIGPNSNSYITITNFQNEISPCIQMYHCVTLSFHCIWGTWNGIDPGICIISSLSPTDIRMSAILRFAPKSESESLFNLSESAPF